MSKLLNGKINKSNAFKLLKEKIIRNLYSKFQVKINKIKTKKQKEKNESKASFLRWLIRLIYLKSDIGKKRNFSVSWMRDDITTDSQVLKGQ